MNRRQQLEQSLDYLYGKVCPNCGLRGEGIESNGKGTFLCPRCHHQWGSDHAGEHFGFDARPLRVGYRG